MKKLLAVILSAVLAGTALALAAFAVIGLIKNEPELPDVPMNDSTATVNGCYVLDFFPFTGENPEDGSFGHAENVAAVRIKNNSSIDLRYAEITVKTQVGDYVFLATSWMAGKEMTVLESTGAKLYDKFIFESAEITSIDTFEKDPSLYEEQFETTLTDGELTIKNISQLDTEDEITVYFKAVDENGVFGGLTYRIAIDGIKAGETKTLDTGIHPEHDMKIVFITVRGQ